MRFVALMLLGGVVAATACTSSSATPNGDPDSDSGVSDPDADARSLDEACEQLAKTRCARLVECTAPTFVDPSYDCERNTTALCRRHATALSNIDVAAVDACTANTRTEACAQIFARRTLCDFPAGKQADGSVCLLGSDCASGYCQERGSCNVCMVNPFPPTPPAFGSETVGAFCNADKPCNPWRGLRCDDTTHTCQEFTPDRPGESCEIACTIGSVCSVIKCYDAQHCSKWCWKPRELGEECGGIGACNTGLECTTDAGTSTCTPKTTKVCPPD